MADSVDCASVGSTAAFIFSESALRNIQLTLAITGKGCRACCSCLCTLVMGPFHQPHVLTTNAMPWFDPLWISKNIRVQKNVVNPKFVIHQVFP